MLYQQINHVESDIFNRTWKIRSFKTTLSKHKPHLHINNIHVHVSQTSSFHVTFISFYMATTLLTHFRDNLHCGSLVICSLEKRVKVTNTIPVTMNACYSVKIHFSFLIQCHLVTLQTGSRSPEFYGVVWSSPQYNIPGLVWINP